MAYMLRVSARQIGDPILMFVQVKTDDCLIHAIEYFIIHDTLQISLPPLFFKGIRRHCLGTSLPPFGKGKLGGIYVTKVVCRE